MLVLFAGMGKHRAEPTAGEALVPRQSVKVGKLNLVDLAGSERVHITGATGTLYPNTTPCPKIGAAAWYCCS